MAGTSRSNTIGTWTRRTETGLNVFVDTSAIYAGIDRDDPSSQPAVATWRQLVEADDQLVSHSLVEVETIALVQRRLGVAAVEVFRDRFLPGLSIVEVDLEQRRQVLLRMSSEGHRDLSFVDWVSFELMRGLNITRAFAFDRHFSEAGFELIGPS